jgi:hypothetical protein
MEWRGRDTHFSRGRAAQSEADLVVLLYRSTASTSATISPVSYSRSVTPAVGGGQG